MRLLTIITGILSILVAVWCFANQGAVFASVAFIIGIMMLVQGICEVYSYFYARQKMGHAAYILAEGAADFILGIIVLANRLDTEVAVPVFFGMWILYSGAMRVATAVNNRNRGGKTWSYIIAVGAASIITGIHCFLNSSIAGVSSVMLLSICFIIKGMDIIATGIEMPRQRRVKNEKTARTIELLNIEKKNKGKRKQKKSVLEAAENAEDAVISGTAIKSENEKSGDTSVSSINVALPEQEESIKRDINTEEKADRREADDEDAAAEIEEKQVEEAKAENAELDEARKEKFIRETLGSLFDTNDEEDSGNTEISFTKPVKEKGKKVKEEIKKDSWEDDDIINDILEKRISQESDQIKLSWMKQEDDKDLGNER